MSLSNLLVFVGPDKAGSTYFWDTLKIHPSISVAPSKELFFFDRYYARGTTWYFKQFHSGSTGLDCSHDYFFCASACERLKSIAESHFKAGHVLIVVSLRDPLDRAVSAYKYMLWQGRTKLPFENAVFEIDELLDHGDYGRWLPMWRSAFGDSLVLLDFAKLIDGVDAFNLILRRLGHDLLSEQSLPDNNNPARRSNIPAPIMRTGRSVGRTFQAMGFNKLQSMIKEFVVRTPLFSSEDTLDPFREFTNPQLEHLKYELNRIADGSKGYISEEMLSCWRSNWDKKLG